jgi:hypothetical protein
MEWRKIGRVEISDKEVEIKSVKIQDEMGKIRRLRVSTVWSNFSNFTRIPCIANLCKEEKGYIGVLVRGKNGGFVKIGKNFIVCQSLVLSLSSIGKKNLKKLIKGTNIDVLEIDGLLYGIEK